MDRQSADDELLILGRSARDEIIEFDERRRAVQPQPARTTAPEASYAPSRRDPASLAGIWVAIGEL